MSSYGDFKVQCGDDTPKSYQKFQLNKLVDRDYELQLNLSSTAVCAYVLSQYQDILSGDDYKEKFGDIIEYYKFIIYLTFRRSPSIFHNF